MGPETRYERRTRRELKTVRVMIGMYCRGQHGDTAELCESCGAIWGYAQHRVERCKFGTAKPTCLNCTVHCYKPEMRERIREVMRYAGPRMALRHPLLSLLHYLDGKDDDLGGTTPPQGGPSHS